MIIEITDRDEQEITKALTSAFEWIRSAEFPEGAVARADWRGDWLICKEYFANGRIRMELLLWGWFGGERLIEIWFLMAEPKKNCSILDILKDGEIDLLKSIIGKVGEGREPLEWNSGHSDHAVMFEMDLERGPGVVEAFENLKKGCLEHRDKGCDCGCGWKEKGIALLTVPEGWKWEERCNPIDVDEVMKKLDELSDVDLDEF